MKLEIKERCWEVSNDEKPNLMSWLTINRACNLRCVWCYAKMTGYGNDTMSLETVDVSIRLLKSLGLKSAILIGGEPTVHPDFIEIVQMLRKANLNAYLVTNAIAFSDNDFLKRTLDAGVSSVTISFKATNRESFIADTGRDYFNLAVKAVGNIAKSGVHHVVNITACNNLMTNFDEMIQVIESTGTNKLSIDTGKPIFLNGKSCADGMGTPRDMADFFMSAYPKLEKSGLRFSVKIAVPFCLFPQDFVDKMIDDGNILTGCQMVSGRGLVIDPLGRVLPCNHLCDLFIGRIGRDFCNSDDFWKFRRNKEMLDFYEFVGSYPDKKCSECPYWTMCGAGCRLYWLHYDAESMLGSFGKK